ncbi:uncharacterized protein [Mytilus edulis]|uniref:uncharacterized protein n=1 Tax=Mytilus edulis TaxID=6550 RepID=UPI0039F0AFD3
MDLLRQEAIHQVNYLFKLRDNLHCRSREHLSDPKLDEIQVRLGDINHIESHKLHVKQINKFERDGVQINHPSIRPSTKSKKKPRNRRFKRKIRVPMDPNNTVVNLSSVSLSEDETKVLSKGLNFCPTPNSIDNMKLGDDLDNFARTLRIKEYFGNKDKELDNEEDTDTSDSEEEIIIPHFKKKSSWIPKPSKSATLEDVIDKIKSDVVHLASNKYSSFYNTSPDEKKAIQSLRNRDDIVIKPADKGSAVVIMDKANYIAEAVRQLSDERFYKKLDYDPTSEFSSKIITALQTMYNDGHIDEDTIGYLKPENAKPGRLYLLPKIHKVNNPGRPIVSANGHPTEKISEFVDFHLRSHVENLPSHIQDTTDYLRKMESMNPLPPETLLVTLDVTSLYTNIPHDDGIQSCREIWDSRNILEPPTECLVQLLTLVLKCNNFTFNGDHYLQINGTAMGTKMAPSYANIFMGRLEKQIIAASLSKPLSWFRFIDDVDMKWIESQQKLDDFIRHANNAHHSIKFTYEISDSKISFLDTTTSIKDGVISTDLYFKTFEVHSLHDETKVEKRMLVLVYTQEFTNSELLKHEMKSQDTWE